MEKMKKEMKCYNVVFEKSKKEYLYLAGDENSSDSGYIGKWLIMPNGKKIKIVSIVFYPKNVIEELPYNLKKINLAELSTSEKISVVQKEEEADSVAMVKEIFRDMGISI
jgi:hypothetical protein